MTDIEKIIFALEAKRENFKSHEQDMCEHDIVWEHGDKIRCIDGSEQNTLKLNDVYTVDTSMNTTDNRVYVKENKRFSFLKSRFELVEVLLWNLLV